ncbi:hypothetical protein Ancab_008882 [Ancistrocladus abbreviatus]
MKKIYLNMYPNEEDAPEKSRQRRQRRIELMRNGTVQKRRMNALERAEMSAAAETRNDQAVTGVNRVPTANEEMSSHRRHLHYPYHRKHLSSSPSSEKRSRGHRRRRLQQEEDREAGWLLWSGGRRRRL